MSRQRSIIAAFHVLVFASIAACGGLIADDQVETDSALYGVGTIARAWGNTNGAVVPTCWMNPDDHIDLQIRVRQIIRETWESYANVSFTGSEPSLPFGGIWPSCSGTTSRRVGVAFSEVANYRGNTGRRRREWSAGDVDCGPRAGRRTTRAFDTRSSTSSDTRLGFTHEMQRPDNWNGNTAYQCGGDAHGLRQLCARDRRSQSDADLRRELHHELLQSGRLCAGR